MKIQVIFYSTYGHTYRMAEAVAEGARSVGGAEVSIYQVEEVIPEHILKEIGAYEMRKAFAHIPIARPEQLGDADAIILGTPTRYGNMAGQMRNFLDQTGVLWVKNALVGKVGSVFTSSNTQHGGQETTIVSTHFTMLHHGMIIVGLPYSEKRQSIMTEITGGSPYGASTIAGHKGSRWPSENELEIAKFQGRHVAEITRALVRGRGLD
jgi:NAD(P)H dehydrogenase (quinone)